MYAIMTALMEKIGLVILLNLLQNKVVILLILPNNSVMLANVIVQNPDQNPVRLLINFAHPTV
jgi:hypothetical protein